jgi:hypothetical protein
MLHTFVSWEAAKHDTICTHQRAPLRCPALRPICNLRKKSEGNLAGSSLFIQLCRTVLLCIRHTLGTLRHRSLFLRDNLFSFDVGVVVPLDPF